MFKRYLVYVLILAFPSIIFAQKNKVVLGDKDFAKELYDNRNYKKAIDEYLILLKTDSTNVTYKHNLALCYLNLNIEKDKTLKLLETVTKQPKCDPNAWYDLAFANQRLMRFDDAINYYRKFIELVKNKDKNYIPATRQIEICENAKVLIKKPINVSIEFLGNEINSITPDFKPYISADEKFLVFTSKRRGNIGNLIDFDGFNTSDIFSCNFNNGKWEKPKRLPATINTTFSEDCTGLTADGSTIVIHYDSDKTMGDILISSFKGKSFMRPLDAGSEINSNKDEQAACLSPDKQTMFFSSNREGGMGAKDLYYSRKLPSGEWTKPVNLGLNINTEYDENYPYIAPDGETLYFCSVGHNSMGGYDIFKAKWDKLTNTFSKPENIGFPINTSDDERTISFTQSGRYAYANAFRKDGIGDRDICRIIFNDIPPTKTVITGKIIISDSTQSKSKVSDTMFAIEDIKITVIDKKTALFKDKCTPDKNSGKYIVNLLPGEYLLKFEGNTINPFEFELIIPDRELTEKEIYKDITLIHKKQ